MNTSLLILFVWQIIGFVGYFEFSHYRLKKEIKTLLKQGVSKEELIIFEFSAEEMKDLVWLKKNEFDLHGNLFDVVRKHKRNNGTTYMECISDKKEKVLFAHLGENISVNLGDNDHPSQVANWMKLLQLPVEPVIDELIIPDFVVYELFQGHLFFYGQMISEKSVNIVSPPPC